MKFLEKFGFKKDDIAALKELNVQIIEDDFVIIEDGVLRHNTMKLAFHIFSNLL